MRSKLLQFTGLFLIFIGTFLPLVKIPIIGSWNYFEIDPALAFLVWICVLIASAGVKFEKNRLVKILSFVLLLIFLFTIFAIKYKAWNFFKFLPFASWQNTFAGIIKLGWGWLIEFAGLFILLILNKTK